MALIYHTANINTLFASTLLKQLAHPSNNNFTNPATNWTPSCVTVYKGTMPTPADIIVNWSAYNSGSADYLVNYDDGKWNLPSWAAMLQLSTLPSARTPVNTGTATWAIIWVDNPQPDAPLLAGTVLPSTTFMVVNVSDLLGDGVVRFTSPALVSGTPVAIADATIAVSI